MPKVEKTLHDDLSATVTITINKPDFEPEFTKEIKNFRKNAQWKGFRKGTAPIGYIKKVAGPELLSKVINNLIQNLLNEKIKEDGIQFLGYPIPSDGQDIPTIEMDLDREYQFSFDIGIEPTFVLQEADGHVFDKYVISNTDELAQKDLLRGREQMGEPSNPEEGFVEEDFIEVQLQETKDGAILEGGYETVAAFKINELTNKQLKKAVLNQKIETSFDINVFEDLAKKDKAEVYRDYLKIQDGAEPGGTYQATLKKVHHTEPADLDQTFFDGFFGPGTVKTEEEALEKMKEYIVNYYNQQSDQIISRKWAEHLMEVNKFDLPEAFLKRFMVVTNENTKLEDIEKDWDNIQKDLRWSIIKNKLLAKYKVAVTAQEVEHEIAHLIARQYGGMDPHSEMIVGMAKKIMEEDKNLVEQTHRNMLESKLFMSIRDTLKTKDILLDDESFKDKFQEVAG